MIQKAMGSQSTAAKPIKLKGPSSKQSSSFGRPRVHRPCSLEPTEFTPRHALLAVPAYAPPRRITVIQRPELCQESDEFWPKTKKEANGAPCDPKLKRT